MSETLQDVLNAKHRVSVEVVRRLSADDLQRLEASVRGEADRSIRPRAMDVLVAARGAGAMRVLADVLDDGDEDVTVRASAAFQLGRTGPSGEDALVSAVGTARDPVILIAAASALGKVGSGTALDALADLTDRDDPVGRQARLAAALIAIRGQREGFSPPGAGVEPLPLPDEKRVPLAQRALRDDEARAAFEDLRQDAYGVDLAQERAFRLDCGPGRFLVALDREPVSTGRPTLAGLVARRSEEDGTFSVSWLVLSSPAKDGSLQIGVYRPSGHQVLAGSARVADRESTFELHSVRGRGNLPVEVTGTVVGGQVTAFAGTSAPGRSERGAPTPETS